MISLSLDHALLLYTIHRDNAQEGAEWSGWTLAAAGWDPQWFPACASTSGTVVAVDCRVDSDLPAPLRVIGKADEDPERVDAPGLLWVVERWIWAIESGVSRYINGQWETDRSRVPDDLDASCLL